jgi:cytochrome c5
MKLTATVLVTGLMLSGCALDGDDNGKPADESINGEAAYLEYCASCHEKGMFGAPREGEPRDWQSRSSLWQAVLMEHAKEGYFNMPARGGQAELPDDVINAAAQYMLEMTFSDRPRD